MASKKMTQAALSRAVSERREEARKRALAEIKDVKSDLAQLEKLLQSKKEGEEFALLDLVHGAYETFRHAQVVFDSDKLLAELQEELDRAKDEEYLAGAGAHQLKQPAGWHWISPKGEMVYLAEAADIAGAAEKLRDLRNPARRKQQAARKTKSKAENGSKAEATSEASEAAEAEA